MGHSCSNGGFAGPSAECLRVMGVGRRPDFPRFADVRARRPGDAVRHRAVPARGMRNGTPTFLERRGSEAAAEGDADFGTPAFNCHK